MLAWEIGQAARQKRIVCLGNSTTRRNDATWHNWPEFDFRYWIGPYARVINKGDPGAVLDELIVGAPLSIRPSFPHFVIVLAGLNDCRETTDTAATIQGKLTTIYDYADDFGAVVVPVTITPWNDGFWTAGRETVRQDVNTFIKTRPNAVDLEPTIADNTDPSHPVLKAQYNQDGIHFNFAGSAAVAQQIFLQGFDSTPIGRQ